MNTSTYGVNNQLTARSAGGTMLFRGQLDEPAKVTINGNAALTRGDRTFTGETTVNSGTNPITIVATEARNNARTKNYQVTVGGAR